VILVDTSVWIDYLRGVPRAASLADHLEVNEVLVHPFVRGELALGRVSARAAAVLEGMELLPSLRPVDDDEVLAMVRERRLAGSGIGWVDAHLLGAALAARADLWTFDRSLARVAAKHGVAFARS
jgi:predicted nucleic acid-binding protein